MSLGEIVHACRVNGTSPGSFVGTPLRVTSVTRNSVGNYTVTLSTGGLDVRDATVHVTSRTIGRSSPSVVSTSDTVLTILWYDDAGGGLADTDFDVTVVRTNIGGLGGAVVGPIVGTAPVDEMKDSARLATTGALQAYARNGNVITGNAVGAITDGSGAGMVDGVTVVNGDRIVLQHGAVGQDNGIYDVTDRGGATAMVLTRSGDADVSAEVTLGMAVPIDAGTRYGGTFRRLVAAGATPIVLNTTTLTFGELDVAFRGGLQARGVETDDVANLAAFPVAGTDGVTYVEGDRVLLVGQGAASSAANGLYTVGVVAGPNAPLTRSLEMPAGFSVYSGLTCEVAEGTLFNNTTWKITTTGTIVVGTTAHAWYPRQVTQSIALVAGTTTFTTVPVLSLTKTNVVCTRQIANTCVATDGGYHATVGGATGLVAGLPAVAGGGAGTGSVTVQATVLAGTINNADISTLHVTVQNW